MLASRISRARRLRTATRDILCQLVPLDNRAALRSGFFYRFTLCLTGMIIRRKVLKPQLIASFVDIMLVAFIGVWIIQQGAGIRGEKSNMLGTNTPYCNIFSARKSALNNTIERAAR